MPGEGDSINEDTELVTNRTCTFEGWCGAQCSSNPRLVYKGNSHLVQKTWFWFESQLYLNNCEIRRQVICLSQTHCPCTENGNYRHMQLTFIRINELMHLQY